jgi:hypothetical protein
MAPASDDLLARVIYWPRNHNSYSFEEIRALFRTVRRFIDFDQTVAFRAPGEYRAPTLRGKPLAEFLSEEPFIVQTINPNGAALFFGFDFPELPKPVMIIMPPGRYADSGIWKDFEMLGITGATIIDDLPAHEIHAPGCLILPPE